MKNILIFLFCWGSFQIQASWNLLGNNIKRNYQNFFYHDQSSRSGLVREQNLGDPYMDKKDDWESLLLDVSQGDFEKVYQFLNTSHRIDFNRKDRRSGDTLLMRAVEAQDADMVKLLLDNGAHVNTSNLSGMTPLMKAVMLQDRAVIDCLLSQRYISLEEKNEFGETALMIACSHGNVDTVRTLVSKGVKLDTLDRQGQFVYDRLRYFDCDPMEYKIKIKKLAADLKQKVNFVAQQELVSDQVQDAASMQEQVQLAIEETSNHP